MFVFFFFRVLSKNHVFPVGTQVQAPPERFSWRQKQPLPGKLQATWVQLESTALPVGTACFGMEKQFGLLLGRPRLRFQ